MRCRCRPSSVALLLLASSSLIVAAAIAGAGGGSRNTTTTRYNALFAFGDSITEDGNICIVASSNSTELEVLTLTHPPYGRTYFGRPACRWSDGRIGMDFIAEALGLPLLPPSKSRGRDFRRGANMAITGGTALNFSFYNALGVEDPIWNHGSLSTQMQWFEELILPSVCGTKQKCKAFLEKSLFVLGGFGGNDYNIQLLELALTVEQAMKNSPVIVNAIANSVERLLALGAVHVVVPGILPTGCLPLFLSLFASSSGSSSSSSNKEEEEADDFDLDEYGCLRSYNRLTEHHNLLLQEQVKLLQRKHNGSARIMFADHSQAYYQMVKQPHKFGISDPFEACCGAGGGKYNFDIATRCGMPGATTACRHPSARLSWDGVHPTEAANKIIADSWLNGPYCTPPILK